MLRGTIQTLTTLLARGELRLPLDWVTVLGLL